MSREAIKDAQFNVRRNHLEEKTVKFKAGDAPAELRNLAVGSYDLVVLDPPRAGAAACLPELVRLRPTRIVYVSCDSATLDRDAKALMASGYHIDMAVPLDLFPQTAHVETVARLEYQD